MIIDKEDFEVQSSNTFWAGRLIDLPKNEAWEIADEIVAAIKYATELKSDSLHNVVNCSKCGHPTIKDNFGKTFCYNRGCSSWE